MAHDASGSGSAVLFGFGMLLACLGAPGGAEAFCGFYVSESGENLYNDATAVSLMRQDRATVMAMENNYRGPPEDFAMVVPVPEVLDEDRVRTLEDGVFERLRKQTAPRLVEYWEQDPCPDPPEDNATFYDFDDSTVEGQLTHPDVAHYSEKVTVEEKFQAGEYDIVVLSSEESNALESWLRERDYNIPDGAEKYFRPYVRRGSYFFVAKVDVDRLEFDGETARLSPIRFHYESRDFRLPIRLGLINSDGTQDLLAFTLAEGQRYAVVNRKNVRIPTNLVVEQSVKGDFGLFYDRLYSRVRAAHEDPVVTEYAWQAGKCDPCPTDPLSVSDFQALGGDVIDEVGEESGPEKLLEESIAVENEGVSAESIESTLQHHRGVYSICVDHAAALHEIYRGNVILEFEIGPGGKVRDYAVERDDFDGAGDCIGRRLSDISFGSFEDKTEQPLVTVRKVFRFEDVLGDDEPTGPAGWTVTRMHYRYDEEVGGRDLVFAQAPPISGGRGRPQGRVGAGFSISDGTRGERNQFQGRYMILHEWSGELECEDPRRGRWGRRNGGASAPSDRGAASSGEGATDLQLDEAVRKGTVPGTDTDGEAGD